mmetsp:Transcript_1927/g.4745  ORF Transcript_1927/g.4745 Transcript_1927/m.4745 type:complete len:319 (+) Transcript_1927:559-1515(+)
MIIALSFCTMRGARPLTAGPVVTPHRHAQPSAWYVSTVDSLATSVGGSTCTLSNGTRSRVGGCVRVISARLGPLGEVARSASSSTRCPRESPTSARLSVTAMDAANTPSHEDVLRVYFPTVPPVDALRQTTVPSAVPTSTKFGLSGWNLQQMAEPGTCSVRRQPQPGSPVPVPHSTALPSSQQARSDASPADQSRSDTPASCSKICMIAVSGSTCMIRTCPASSPTASRSLRCGANLTTLIGISDSSHTTSISCRLKDPSGAGATDASGLDSLPSSQPASPARRLSCVSGLSRVPTGRRLSPGTAPSPRSSRNSRKAA